MDGALATTETQAGAPDAELSGWAAPPVEVPAFTLAELDAWFRGGEPEADVCERFLATAARVRGALLVATAEGLHALRQGNRLEALACHLVDYGREVLDLGKRSVENLARLGEGLATRPLLRDALRSGRVQLRAAETVLEVAVGEAEGRWVSRAARQTVAELAARVRAARAGAPDGDDEPWVRLRTQLPPDDRLLVDEAFAVARTQLPGSTRVEQVEAMAQEYLGSFPGKFEADATRPLGPGFRACGRGHLTVAEARARAAAVAELPPVLPIPVPDLAFDETATAQELDAQLRALARFAAGWDRLIGRCGYAVRRSRMYEVLGYRTFGAYAEGRLGLPSRTVEQRVALEERLRESPALEAAQERGVSYERLRILSKLSDSDIAAWTPRALELTCIALKREVQGEKERQLRARQTLALPLPRRVAVLVSAAIESVRERFGPALSTGRCLAIMAFHLLGSWPGTQTRARTRSQKVLERDHGWCQVPGCSHRASHAHHVIPRSRGGADDPWNLVSVCAFHHLRCIHGGYLAVFGRAPTALTWVRGGKVWRGPQVAAAGAVAD